MRILNLADVRKSDINYHIIRFSDSQITLEIQDPKSLYFEECVVIKSRMSWEDLQLIIQAVYALKELEVSKIKLYLPYFLGGRSDRRFLQGQAFYLKEVTTKIINSLPIDEVSCIDTHSLVTDSLIDKFKLQTDVVQVLAKAAISYTGEDSYLVAPDEGSNKRVDNIAKKLKNNVVRCLKDRDISTGRIKSITVLSEDLNNKDCIVIDDICDGGGTFIPLAKSLKSKNAGRLILCVTHGIFSRGFDELLDHYDMIVSTNSVKDIESTDRIIIYDIF